VVVEAMKMENELRAAREGTVAEVHAREGLSVDAGALLLVIQ
jgi:biotin carboxyl carrier protein